MLTIENRSSLSIQAFETVRRVLAGFSHAGQVIRLSQNQGPAISLACCVSHEDGTSDLVVTRQADAWVISFRVASDQRVLSATVWDRMPSSEELRDVRRTA